MEDGHRRRSMTAGQALMVSGAPMLGVALGNLLTDGLSWGDLVPSVVTSALLFLLLMAFFGRRRPSRRR